MIASGPASNIRSYAGDVSKIDDVARVFDSVDRDPGEPDLVVFNAGAFERPNVFYIDPANFDRYWQIGCFAALLVPDAIAETYLKLHRQPRSAWAHEIDVRPWSEKF